MKTLLKYLVVASMMLACSLCASAEEVADPAVYTEQENISFDYSCNAFSITDAETTEEKELTVMLVKGDYTNKSLAEIVADEVYYVGQAAGTSYAEVFNGIGMRYDNGAIEPGVYTLITSGYGNVAATKTKLFIGNAINSLNVATKYVPAVLSTKKVTYGEILNTLRVFEEGGEEYSYVGVGKFALSGILDKSKIGFVLQKQDSNGALQKVYKSLDDLKVMGFENITSVEGSIKIGLQVNDIDNGTELVAIPYAEVEEVSVEE